MRDAHPTFVIGPKGSGRTAAALILAWDELFSVSEVSNHTQSDLVSTSTLPVYWQCNYQDRNTDFLGQYAIAYAQTLMGYIAATPYVFLQAENRKQSAMAMLFSLYIESGGDLRAQFTQHRMRPSPMPSRFYEILDSQMGKMRYSRHTLYHIEPARLLQLLFDACPNSVVKVLPIVDVHYGGTLQERGPLEKALQTTLESLLHVNMPGTVFVPSTLDEHRDLSVSPLFINWKKAEIQQLLEKRLFESTEDSRYDLSVFCDYRGVDSISNITDRVIEASNFLPGRLIEIIQHFIRKIEVTNELLRQDDVDEILAHFEQSIG